MRPLDLRLAHSSLPLRLQNSTYYPTPLGGTILPSVMRNSVFTPLSQHSPIATLPRLRAHVHIRTAERALTPLELFAASAVGTLREVLRRNRGGCHPRCAQEVVAPAPRSERWYRKRRWWRSCCPRWVGQEASRPSRMDSGSASWIFRRGTSSGKGRASRASTLAL